MLAIDCDHIQRRRDRRLQEPNLNQCSLLHMSHCLKNVVCNSQPRALSARPHRRSVVSWICRYDGALWLQCIPGVYLFLHITRRTLPEEGFGCSSRCVGFCFCWTLNRSVWILLFVFASTDIRLSVHTYMVLEFPKSSLAVESPTMTFAVDNGLAVLIILIVQLSYAHRIRGYNTAIAAFVGFISITAFSLGMAMTVKMAQLKDFNFMAYESMKAITGSCQGLTLAAGLITTGMLYLHHDPSKSTLKNKSSTMPYDDLIDFIWERGVAGTILQFIYFVVFLSSPADRFWMPFQFTARRAFMLGLVTLYINRGIAQGREISDSPDKIPASTNNVIRARKTDPSTTTDFSTLRDLPTSSNTDIGTKNNSENIFRIDVTKTVEHDSSFGDYKKPLETGDSE